MTSIEWTPSLQSEWVWRSPRRSARVISVGSRPSRAASISPRSSRSSGSIQARSRKRVDARLVGERPEVGGVAGQRLAVLVDPDEALLGQAPAAVAGDAAEPDVVVGRAREVDEVGARLARAA